MTTVSNAWTIVTPDPPPFVVRAGDNATFYGHIFSEDTLANVSIAGATGVFFMMGRGLVLNPIFSGSIVVANQTTDPGGFTYVFTSGNITALAAAITASQPELNSPDTMECGIVVVLTLADTTVHSVPTAGDYPAFVEAAV